MLDTTFCPECDAPAEVQWRAVLESTDGPTEHAKVLCLRRHWFLLPVDRLPGVRGDSRDRPVRIAGGPPGAGPILGG